MQKKGFTLIEMMIVIAIIGILATIAVPAYQDYVVRTKVAEGLNLVNAAKLAVAETTASNHALPQNQAETGYESPASTAYVHSITIGDNGIITITYDKNIDNSGTILFVPTLHSSGDITWTCTGGTLANKYRPANCRNQS